MAAFSRRGLLAAGTATFALASVGLPRLAWGARPYIQPALPFGDADLAPTISSQTVQLHYGKHHAAYYAALNRLTENTRYAALSLEQIVRESAAAADGRPLFNQAGQAWNHDFYWQVLKPGSNRRPTGKLAEAIDRDFGGFDKFKEIYAQRATGIFGSGWGWLVQDGARLALLETSNADTPIAHGKHPLATIDVWEHAYYLDYQNRRADHVKAVLDNLINWDFVRDRMS